jgi:hypothetical protein
MFSPAERRETHPLFFPPFFRFLVYLARFCTLLCRRVIVFHTFRRAAPLPATPRRSPFFFFFRMPFFSFSFRRRTKLAFLFFLFLIFPQGINERKKKHFFSFVRVRRPQKAKHTKFFIFRDAPAYESVFKGFAAPLFFLFLVGYFFFARSGRMEFPASLANAARRLFFFSEKKMKTAPGTASFLPSAPRSQAPVASALLRAKTKGSFRKKKFI